MCEVWIPDAVGALNCNLSRGVRMRLHQRKAKVVMPTYPNRDNMATMISIHLLQGFKRGHKKGSVANN